MQGSPGAVHEDRLLIKRAPKPARILQSPFVVEEGKSVLNTFEFVIITQIVQNYSTHEKDADLVTFQKLFNKDSNKCNILHYLIPNCSLLT